MDGVGLDAAHGGFSRLRLVPVRQCQARRRRRAGGCPERKRRFVRAGLHAAAGRGDRVRGGGTPRRLVLRRLARCEGRLGETRRGRGLLIDEPLLNIVLFQPEIPQNTGNVGRTCVAIGAKLWLVRPLAFRIDDAHLRRAGLDYWQHLEWEAVDDWRALRDRLPIPEPWYFTKTATRLYTNASYTPSDVLVFGSETQGLPKSLLEANTERSLRIPIRPQVRSLNLASSVAVAAYEALRQIEVCANRPE
ncbi:MAG: tRNA (cytidine(34)-2'-O)-methyltransferase [Pirellulaceae bacterium]|nr:tRNA (cytidine(34)-2'-O)-methyltransferase [Pirellulaceae bacterium]